MRFPTLAGGFNRSIEESNLPQGARALQGGKFSPATSAGRSQRPRGRLFKCPQSPCSGSPNKKSLFSESESCDV